LRTGRPLTVVGECGARRHGAALRGRGRSGSIRQRHGDNRGISLVRYADDLVATAPTQEILSSYVIPKLTAFLGERGLRLSEAKTRIVHIDQGFNFLGFTVRRYKGVVLTRPQKAKLLRHLRGIGDYLRQHRQATASQIIGDLGPMIGAGPPIIGTVHRRMRSIRPITMSTPSCGGGRSDVTPPRRRHGSG
jgi:RNA-directed DNA polymerase